MLRTSLMPLSVLLCADASSCRVCPQLAGGTESDFTLGEQLAVERTVPACDAETDSSGAEVSTAVPDSDTLTTTLVTPDGAVLDTSTATGTVSRSPVEGTRRRRHNSMPTLALL